MSRVVSAPRWRWLQAAHQLAGIDAERGRELQDVVEAYIALPPFDLADHRPVDAARLAKALLAPSQPGALGADACAELLCRLGNRLRCHRRSSPYIS